MGSSDTVLVSRKSLVHHYSEMGFRPSEVWYAADNYVTALGIHTGHVNLYSLHAVEITAFQLYVNRHLVPVPSEEHEARVSAVAYSVQAIFKTWGATTPDVIEKLGLDTSRGATYADVLDTVELYVSGSTNCQCVTASMSSITVDGVDIPYPLAVGEAVWGALRFASTRLAVEPF